MESPHFRPLSTCSAHSRTRYQTVRDTPVAPEPVKWFTLNPILNLLTLPLIPSQGNPNKGSTPWFRFSFCPLVDPGAFPIDLPPWCAPSPWELWVSFTDIVFWSLGPLVPQICYECIKFKAIPKCLLAQNRPRLTWHLSFLNWVNLTPEQLYL